MYAKLLLMNKGLSKWYTSMKQKGTLLELMSVSKVKEINLNSRNRTSPEQVPFPSAIFTACPGVRILLLPSSRRVFFTFPRGIGMAT